MISLIICTHGSLATSLKKTTEMIFGVAERLTCLSLLEGQDMFEFSMLISDQYSKDVQNGYQPIVLTDLPNASPFNSAVYGLSQYPEAKIITGVNLPLILELLVQTNYNQQDSLDYNQIIQAARDSITLVNIQEYLE